MKIKQKFNTLTYNEYIQIIDNHKKFSDFNALGLFRSLVETQKLDINQKIAIRDYANQKFYKNFEFLQLKDPDTYFHLKTLGENLTVADEAQIWKDIKLNCGYDWCPYNGLMIKPGSSLSERDMRFYSDKCKAASFAKSENHKKQRKIMKQLIQKELAGE